VSDDNPNVSACPACGSDASTDLDPIYLTLYLPKQDPREFALSTCGPCAVSLRGSLQQGAMRLPERNGQSPKRSDDQGDVDWGLPA
jgi:hypothetical protein